MEIYQQAEDLVLICVKTVSSPTDSGGAFKEQSDLLPSIERRSVLGISYQEQEGESVYMAATLKYRDEKAEHPGCGEFILKEGFYLAVLLNNWMSEEGSIGAAFRRITDDTEDIDFPPWNLYTELDLLCIARIFNFDIIVNSIN